MEETKDVLDPWIDWYVCPGSVSRRMFILSLLAAIASACSGPTTSASTKRERDLLDKAAALSERVSVDMHTHAGPFAGNFPFPDSARDRAAVLTHMQAGKLDAAVFSLTTDGPVIRRDPEREGVRQYREPEPGELFRNAQSRFEKAKMQIEDMIVLSPSALVEFKKKGRHCAIVSHEGADALEGNLSRVKVFYDWGV